MMQPARRLGVIGFGRLARDYYMPALRALGRDRVAVADPSPESRAAALCAGAAAAYDTPEALLATESLAAVLIASPPSSHFAAWRATAARRLPVFMEKPFLLPGDLARIDPEDPACRRLMMNFNRRFWRPYRQMGTLLRAGRIGRPLRARFHLRSNVLAWSTVSRHRLDESEGGALYDLGSHILDLVAVTFEDPPSTIEARRSEPGSPTEAIRITLSYPSGFVVECDLAYGGSSRERVLIEGEAGRLRLDDANFRLWCEKRPSRSRRLVTRAVDCGTLASRAFLRDRSMLRASVRDALAAFLEALETDGPFRPGFFEARRVALWAEAAARSIASGRPERLPAE